MRKKIVALLCLFFIIISAVIVGIYFLYNFLSVKEIKDALKSKDVSKISSVYSKAYDSPSKLKTYDKLIYQTIDEMYDDLNNKDFENEAEKSGEDAVISYLVNKWGNIIEETGCSETLGQLSYSNLNKCKEFDDLLFSKMNYCNAIYDYITDKEYETAIDEFNDVTENDSKYGQAQEMLTNCIDEYIQNNLSTVDEYINNDEIDMALTTLESVKSYLSDYGLDTENIQSKIDQTIITYAEKYVQKAEAAFKEHDINAAIGNMEAAKELRPDYPDYQTKIDNYMTYLPFELYLEDNIFQQKKVNGYFEYEQEVKANDKQNYRDVMVITSYNADVKENIYNVTYNLQGKYDTITGKLFVPPIDPDLDEYIIGGHFVVFGDGKKLYTSPTMDETVLPQNINVNISGIQKLEIKFYGGYYSYMAGDFLGIGAGGECLYISNLIAQKNFPK